MPTPGVRQTDRDFVASLHRGLKILSAFDRDEPELTLSEVAFKTGLTPATARRFLLTLKSLGYVGMNGRRFVLRPKVLDLAYSYLDSMNADEALQPYLREMVQRTGDSSSVTVLEGGEIVYIANASVRRLVRLGAGVGSRFPAYPTSMGRVQFTEINPDKIRRHLDKIRADGYAVVQDELEVGLVSLAVPLRNHSGHVFAAMNCASVARRTDGKEMLRTRLDLLREYASQVSSALLRFPALAHSIASDHVDAPQHAGERLRRLSQRRPMARY
jgi:IclR family pca regulon transcriptional regulator